RKVLGLDLGGAEKVLLGFPGEVGIPARGPIEDSSEPVMAGAPVGVVLHDAPQVLLGHVQVEGEKSRGPETATRFYVLGIFSHGHLEQRSGLGVFGRVEAGQAEQGASATIGRAPA